MATNSDKLTYTLTLLVTSRDGTICLETSRKHSAYVTLPLDMEAAMDTAMEFELDRSRLERARSITFDLYNNKVSANAYALR